jgi:hypothetical protein
LQQVQGGQGAEAFGRLLYERLDATLGEYVSACQEAVSIPSRRDGRSKPQP